MRIQPLQANNSRPDGSPPDKSTKGQNLANRRALVLLIVVTMLSIFSIVAVSFVFYAQSEATAARYSRQANAEPVPTLEPEQAFSYFLSQLIYGPPDNTVGWQSAMRGHSLSTNMYGMPDPTKRLAPLTLPYNGVGRLSYNDSKYGEDNQKLVNYAYAVLDPATGTGFFRDPGYIGTRAKASEAKGAFYGGINPPYTYPDLNNMFLAVVNGSGEVLIPSFHRSWTGIGSLAPPAINPNWNTTLTNPADLPKLMAMSLRPLPAYHQKDGKSFPPPGLGGDVDNLPNAKSYVVLPNGKKQVANNDSIWLDLGYPVLIGPDGRKYKPLFAPLIIDLDSRINLNVHGNIRGTNQTHEANQGLGHWEVNPSHVLTTQQPAELQELSKLFLGNGAVHGRYSTDGGPLNGNTRGPALVPVPPDYARIDYDGASNGGTFNYLLPNEKSGSTTAPALTPFPLFDPTRYGNGQATTDETHNHPGYYDLQRALYRLPDPNGIIKDRKLHASHLEALYRFNDTGSPGLTSDIFRLMPRLYSSSAGVTPAQLEKRRWLVTTDSWDFPRPSLAPWLATPNSYLPLNISNPEQYYPVGTPSTFPDLMTGVTNSSDFHGTAHNPLAGLGRIDLNRDLPAYPTTFFTQVDTAEFKQFLDAKGARQAFAKDIYDRLVWLTTGTRPSDQPVPPNPSGPFETRRWLAQLAVNIVDFIDEDNVSTPFQWNEKLPQYWVYGTELPRVVLNEAYSEITNDPTDPGMGVMVGMVNKTVPTKDYKINFWVELYCPLLTSTGPVNLAHPTTAQSIYKIEIYDQPLTNIRKQDNPKGDSDAAQLPKISLDTYQHATPPMVDYKVLKPANGAFNGTNKGHDGFSVIGPVVPFPNPGIQPTLQSNAMSYSFPQGRAPATAPQQNTILLRRLACPHLPHDPNANSAAYNPYITIDYVSGIHTHQNVQWDMNGDPRLDPLQARKSKGRREPYAASEIEIQQLEVPNVPQHTFFRQNSKKDNEADLQTLAKNNMQDATLNYPFTWLVHLDRKLTSPVELLHVSAFRPHELTQQFKTPQGFHKHHAPWFDPNTRLSRLLEVVETPWLRGPDHDRRVPGKININTIFDKEMLSALLNSDQQALFTQMLATRTPN